MNVTKLCSLLFEVIKSVVIFGSKYPILFTLFWFIFFGVSDLLTELERSQKP